MRRQYIFLALALTGSSAWRSTAQGVSGWTSSGSEIIPIETPTRPGTGPWSRRVLPARTLPPRNFGRIGAISATQRTSFPNAPTSTSRQGYRVNPAGPGNVTWYSVHEGYTSHPATGLPWQRHPRETGVRMESRQARDVPRDPEGYADGRRIGRSSRLPLREFASRGSKLDLPGQSPNPIAQSQTPSAPKHGTPGNTVSAGSRERTADSWPQTGGQRAAPLSHSTSRTTSKPAAPPRSAPRLLLPLPTPINTRGQANNP